MWDSVYIYYYFTQTSLKELKAVSTRVESPLIVFLPEETIVGDLLARDNEVVQAIDVVQAMASKPTEIRPVLFGLD